jgi:hypothetical protein
MLSTSLPLPLRGWRINQWIAAIVAAQQATALQTPTPTLCGALRSQHTGALLNTCTWAQCCELRYIYCTFVSIGIIFIIDMSYLCCDLQQSNRAEQQLHDAPATAAVTVTVAVTGTSDRSGYGPSGWPPTGSISSYRRGCGEHSASTRDLTAGRSAVRRPLARLCCTPSARAHTG